MIVHLDFETFSHVDVRKVGAYRYAADPSTKILCMGYAFDDNQVQMWEPHKNPTPPGEFLHAIQNRALIYAHTVQFEKAILDRMYRQFNWPKVSIRQLRCTAARAAVLSLPRGLEKVAFLLGLEDQKSSKGKRLLGLFSRLQKHKGKRKGEPDYRIFPEDSPLKFEELCEYCRQDVEVERAIHNVIPELPEDELEIFFLDMYMNELGLPIDMVALKGAIRIATQIERNIRTEAEEITGGIKLTERDKLLAWFRKNGVSINNLQRKTLEEYSNAPGIKHKEVIDARLELSRAAPKKLISLRKLAVDGVVQGTLLYSGAHTKRWTGKLFQPQNLNRGSGTDEEKANIKTAFELFTDRNPDPILFSSYFSNPFSTIASSIRGFIKAPDGKVLLVVDYKSIEARVLVWVAGQWDKVEAYANGYDLYKIMATKLYGVPYDKVITEQRRIGKNLVLGCGYGLGAVKFIDYCAKENIHIDLDFSKEAVYMYRNEHKKVTRLWNIVELAAITVVKNRDFTGITVPGIGCELGFKLEQVGNMLFLVIILPSGGRLWYPEPRLRQGRDYKGNPKDELIYSSQTKTGFRVNYTYGGKLVENIIQAIARDIMAYGMLRAFRAGYPICLTVHDEIVSITDDINTKEKLEEFISILVERPKWCLSCPIEAEGNVMTRYGKG